MFARSSTPTFNSSSSNYQTPIQSPPIDKIPFKAPTTGMNETLHGTNLLEQVYKIRIQDPFSQEDPTICFQLSLQPSPGEKKRFLDIDSLTTFLVNYGGADFPAGVQLCCSEVSGFLNEQGTPTNVVATMSPTSVNAIALQGNMIGFNIVYNLNSAQIWDITSISTLTFRMKLYGDSSYRPLPSAQPIDLALKITKVLF